MHFYLIYALTKQFPNNSRQEIASLFPPQYNQSSFIK